MKKVINFKKLETFMYNNDVVKYPSIAYGGDAGMDIFAITNGDCNSDNIITLEPHIVTKLRTGISIDLPDGLWIEIRDRSSMALMGITTHGGIIDTGYKGEIQVILINNNNNPVELDLNQAIAQLIVREHHTAEIFQDGVKVDLESSEVRETGGFGSSNK